MLTKKKLRYWLNLAMLALAGVVIVLTALYDKASVEARATVIFTIVGSLRAALPWVSKELVAAVDSSDLPEDEPARKETAK